jgi:hypothetical protein
MSAPQQLTSREYKFLMRGDLFHEPLTAVQTYWHKITDLARQLNWEIVPSGIPWQGRRRDVFYLDTPTGDLHQHHYLLRLRRKYDGEARRPYVEVGLKFRHSDHDTTAAADVALIKNYPQDVDFEEDVLYIRDREFLTYYSLRNRLQKYNGDKLTRLAEAVAIFPILGELGLAPETQLQVVNELTIAERKYTPGLLRQGREHVIEPTLAIWYPQGSNSPLLGEFSFKHKHGKSEEEAEFAKRSLYFFNALRRKFSDDIEAGTSKANITYRHPLP